MLGNLDNALVEEVMWVTGDGVPEAHIYQFSLAADYFWRDGFPDVKPLCGAPSYQRRQHEVFNDEHAFEWLLCVRCATQLVMDHPDIFIQGGT
jgi:hypothetical protein